MKTKGERTREMIVEQAAPLFNTRGYAGVSVSALMAATGLEKGGIYRHFASKDALALAAFDHNFGVTRSRMEAATRSRRHAVDRLLAMLAAHSDVLKAPLCIGGCPILNTAVEADDTDPALAERARGAMSEWRGSVVAIVAKGIERGEVRPDVDPEAVASVLIAGVEGAILLSRLYHDDRHMERVVDHLTVYLNSAVRI